MGRLMAAAKERHSTSASTANQRHLLLNCSVPHLCGSWVFPTVKVLLHAQASRCSPPVISVDTLPRPKTRTTEAGKG